MAPDDQGRREGAGAPSGRPEYKVYRSRPRWFKAPGRAGEPGFDELRESRRADRDGRPRTPITPGRVAKWVAIGIGAWIALSLVLFLISAQIEQSKVSDQAKTALDGGFPLTSATNVLVLGSDARPRNARDCPASGCGPARSDTIMLMRVGAGHSARLSIPRDTIVDIPGHGRDKINAAYAIGGPALTITTVKQYLGIKINHLVEVNFDNFPQFIDSLGGVDYTGPCLRSNISGGKRNGGSTLILPAGTHHLDGGQALTLARTRKNECRPGENDLDRAKRQQQLLSAMKSKLVSPGTFFRLPLVSWEAPKAIRTDMNGPYLLGLFGAMATTGSPTPRVLQPSGAETLTNGGSGLTVSDEEKRSEVQRFLSG
jgi:LCP family protein required for cell wall assembly